jgi:hypothetical protein
MMISYDAPPEGRRPPLREAKVRQGNRGDWSVAIWVRSEAEAIEVAQLINERLGRKQDGAGEP